MTLFINYVYQRPRPGAGRQEEEEEDRARARPAAARPAARPAAPPAAPPPPPAPPPPSNHTIIDSRLIETNHPTGLLLSAHAAAARPPARHAAHVASSNLRSPYVNQSREWSLRSRLRARWIEDFGRTC